jgi:hypothetical protein
VGVTDAFKGPNDEPRSVPIYTIRSRSDLAKHIRRAGIEAGFDLALAQEFTVDHSVVVPLHFMTPNMHIPVIPIFVSGHVAPLPAARRCLQRGATVKRAIESFRESLRRYAASLCRSTTSASAPARPSRKAAFDRAPTHY